MDAPSGHEEESEGAVVDANADQDEDDTDSHEGQQPLPGKLQPAVPGDTGGTQAAHQDAGNGSHQIGEGIAQVEGLHHRLLGQAKDIAHTGEDGNDGGSLGRGGAENHVDEQVADVHADGGNVGGAVGKEAGKGVDDGMHDIALAQNGVDTGCKGDYQGRAGHGFGAVYELLGNLIGLEAADQAADNGSEHKHSGNGVGSAPAIGCTVDHYHETNEEGNEAADPAGRQLHIVLDFSVGLGGFGAVKDALGGILANLLNIADQRYL